ncbi:MAG: RNA polymerase sigma factor RpoH [Syntrophales bacterium]|nr:RNA polymerase sigma factor RpoH [Syntrophales bacterium]
MDLPVAVGSLEIYMSEINRFSLLKADEEFQLAVRFRKHNDMEAAEKLVVSNLRFVVKIAYKYRSYGIALPDLIQEGNIGLMHAVKKFDPYKGYRLLSYAVWWIRAYIQNFIIKSWSLVKIGTTQNQRKLFFKLSEARKRLETLSQKNPEFIEIAKSLGVKKDEIEEMAVRLDNRDISLNTSLDGGDGSRTLIDDLPSKVDNQETMLIKKERGDLVKRNVAGVLANLNDREVYIIKHRVMADHPETLQEIGNRYNITRERARQLEKQALKKLRLALPHLGQEAELLEA